MEFSKFQLSNINSDNNDDILMAGNLKNVEDKIKLQETIYDSLGKAWPSCKETQGKSM